MKSRDKCKCRCHKDESVKHIIPCCYDPMFREGYLEELFQLAKQDVETGKETSKLSSVKWARDLVTKYENGKLSND